MESEHFGAKPSCTILFLISIASSASSNTLGDGFPANAAIRDNFDINVAFLYCLLANSWAFSDRLWTVL